MTKTASDIVGSWTEVKLGIIKEYASAYAKVMAKQTGIRHFAYIDGFAGSGSLRAKSTGNAIPGSPVIALEITPRFSFYHLIDLDGTRAERLRAIARGLPDVRVYEGDCNEILVREVFPECRYEDFRRALCVLDPYELNPNWHVIQTAARMRSVEIFLNFMISDANRNVLWRNPERVSAAQIERMNQFWGDSTWREISYEKSRGLFEEMEEKATNEMISQAYRKRLLQIAGFKFVPQPIPMRNSKGAVLYYLYFASHNETGFKIARSIFNKYRELGIRYGS